MNKQKKKYKRKSVISNFLIVLIGIFIFLVIIFVLVKTKVITNPAVDNIDINTNNTENILDEDVNNSDDKSSIKKVTSYVFDSKTDNSSAGFFSTLTGKNKKQLYTSLVIDEDNLMSYGGFMLNKFVITIFDGEVFETFSGVYEVDNNGNLVLRFLNNMYNNYQLPQGLTVFVGEDYIILDGNKLKKTEGIVEVYKTDLTCVLSSVFGKDTLDFASLVIINNDLSSYGVSYKKNFIITGFNTLSWDYYVGEAYEEKNEVNLKPKNYGLNTLSDVMPNEIKVIREGEKVVIDNVNLSK